uniref:ZPT2-9 n=1 Tax=Petunia hybrida TaxID=4102 RepID=O22089_PETHY|nr:ZPT2-9 [Petunia x hybrida]
MALEIRSRSEEAKSEVSVERLAMENCANILQQRNQLLGESSSKIFECKTCKKQFDSFQALGGHRTSHKILRNKLLTSLPGNDQLPVKTKKHECSICGEQFLLGQALGGHMRKHRDELNQLQQQKKKIKMDDEKSDVSEEVVQEKKGNAGLFFDLNLTPDENEVRARMTSVHS